MSPKPTIFNPFITLVRYPALHPRLHIRLIANVGSGGGGAPVSAAAPAAGGAPAAAVVPVVEEKKESTWTRHEEDARRLPFSGNFSDMVASPLLPWGGGEGAEARRGGGSQAVKKIEAWARAGVGAPGPSL